MSAFGAFVTACARIGLLYGSLLQLSITILAVDDTSGDSASSFNGVRVRVCECWRDRLGKMAMLLKLSMIVIKLGWNGFYFILSDTVKKLNILA